MNYNIWLIRQGVPLALTLVIFLILTAVLYLEIIALNSFTSVDIGTKLRWSDILIGMTIYLKTSVDFAIFIGNLMTTYNRVRHRIAIEIGTAVGNALGTMIILVIWNMFRDVDWLLALMIFIASLVLFRLAEDGLEHARAGKMPGVLSAFTELFEKSIHSINRFLSPLLKYVIPNLTMRPKTGLTFMGLFISSFSVPFILGLDDFAGYVPLFNVVNVFGFGVGVFFGHMILNIFLFISPNRTIKAVQNPIISLLGSVAFVMLALWGLYEVFKLLFLGH